MMTNSRNTGRTSGGSGGAPAQRDIAKSDRGAKPDSTAQMPQPGAGRKTPDHGDPMRQRTHRSAGA